MLSTKKFVELNMFDVSEAHVHTRIRTHEQMLCCHANEKLFKLLTNPKMKMIKIKRIFNFIYACKKTLSSVQLQQIVAAKRRIRTEARTLTSSGWKWKDGKMAIHTTMRRIIDRNQETTEWGEYANNNAGTFIWSTLYCPSNHLFSREVFMLSMVLFTMYSLIVAFVLWVLDF